MRLYGRRKIKTDVAEITAENVREVIAKAMIEHEYNSNEEDYLWNYYKTKTPILQKTKQYRTDVNNKIVEPRAKQIVEFYLGYVFGEPIQYIRRGKDESLNDEIEWLNTEMASQDKQDLDNSLAEWMLVCGVAPRMVLPVDDGFEMYSLDPRYAFNIYYNGLGEPVVASVKYIVKDDGTRIFSVYTANKYFELNGNDVIIFEISDEKAHAMGEPPMVEYTLNNTRMGIFEAEITLLDALNQLESDRVDDVQQFVDSILCILGGAITEETMTEIKETGAMSLPEGVDAKYISAALSQGDTQTLKNDIMAAITECTGMPNRNGGSSTSDTGSAVLLRDGWEIADAKSKGIETKFKSAERQMLSKILKLSEDILGTTLKVSDIGIQFTRRNYEAIQTKATVLNMMLNNNKIHPELAFTHSGMFADPLAAYEMSAEYSKEVIANGSESDNGQKRAGEETNTEQEQ